MSINIYLILSVLLVHWIGDFVAQTDKQAKGKSKNWVDLLEHTFLYTCIWMAPALIYGGYNNISIYLIGDFLGITFLLHTATDFYTSRVNARFHEENKIHELFVSIGFDQILHYMQLFLTILYLNLQK